MTDHRYLLLCRHASHRDGKLVPVKDDDQVWRFPTESVARALLEEMAYGDDRLRLARVLYAPTAEAKATAAVVLRRLGGEPTDADAKPAETQRANARPAGPFWKRWCNGSRSIDGDSTMEEEKPSQPTLPPRPVTIKPPSWMTKEEWKKRRGGGIQGQGVPPGDPGASAKPAPPAVGRKDQDKRSDR